MTPTMIRTEYLSMNLNMPIPVVQSGSTVHILIGMNLTLVGNRREDFEKLKNLAEQAIAIFGESEYVK